MVQVRLSRSATLEAPGIAVSAAEGATAVAEDPVTAGSDWTGPQPAGTQAAMGRQDRAVLVHAAPEPRDGLLVSQARTRAPWRCLPRVIALSGGHTGCKCGGVPSVPPGALVVLRAPPLGGDRVRAVSDGAPHALSSHRRSTPRALAVAFGLRRVGVRSCRSCRGLDNSSTLGRGSRRGSRPRDLEQVSPSFAERARTGRGRVLLRCSFFRGPSVEGFQRPRGALDVRGAARTCVIERSGRRCSRPAAHEPGTPARIRPGRHGGLAAHTASSCRCEGSCRTPRQFTTGPRCGCGRRPRYRRRG